MSGITAPEATAAVGVTYRQLDYWSRRGYLRPQPGGVGSGFARGWPDEELEVGRAIKWLTEAGFTLETAAVLARKIVEQPWEDSFEIARDITVKVDRP